MNGFNWCPFAFICGSILTAIRGSRFGSAGRLRKLRRALGVKTCLTQRFSRDEALRVVGSLALPNSRYQFVFIRVHSWFNLNLDSRFAIRLGRSLALPNSAYQICALYACSFAFVSGSFTLRLNCEFACRD
jgi:hypothetical protein